MQLAQAGSPGPPTHASQMLLPSRHRVHSTGRTGAETCISAALTFRYALGVNAGSVKGGLRRTSSRAGAARRGRIAGLSARPLIVGADGVTANRWPITS